jgi:hypothetical protein
MHKYLDTPVHTLLATVHAVFRRHDVFLFCNGANVLYTLIPRIFGRPTVLNVDGLEWKRAKWGAFGKTVYKMSEFLSTFIPDRVVTDAAEVQAYYMRKISQTDALHHLWRARGTGRDGRDPRALRAGKGGVHPLCQPPGAREQRPSRDQGV